MTTTGTDPRAPQINVEKCPICNSAEVVRLPSGWAVEVAAGKAIPIIGCGNQWHYVFPEVRR